MTEMQGGKLNIVSLGRLLANTIFFALLLIEFQHYGGVFDRLL